MLDGEVEFGAVNCVNEQNLFRQFSIEAFPTFILIGPERGVQQQYHYRGANFLTDDLPNWVRGITADWNRLFMGAALTALTAEAFEEEVIASEDLWVVYMSGGPKCSRSRDALANVVRATTALSGRARVGVLDCSAPEAAPLCAPHTSSPSPRFVGFPRGPKTAGMPGTLLFNSADVPSHQALPLIEAVVRLALDHTLHSGLAVPGDADYKDDRPPPPPPPPPPQYQAPPPKPVFAELPAASNQQRYLT